MLSTEQHIPAEIDEAELELRDKERYVLYYRRFAHLGPAKIAKLYKVPTL